MTYRSDFNVIGEEVIIEEDFSKGLYNWNIESFETKEVCYEKVQEKEGWILKLFSDNGGAFLNKSTVASFRMEFDIRLDGSLKGEDTGAFINIRNFFEKRYLLILYQTGIQLLTSKIKHSEPKIILEKNKSLSLHKWYHFEIVNVRANIKVFMNEALIIDYTDVNDPIELGNIWFEIHHKYSIANVKVYKLEEFVKIEEEKAEEIKEQEKLVPKEKITVVVADFENLGVETYELSLIMDLYTDSLLETGAFRVLERKELDKVLEEQSLQFSDISNSENAVKIGKILNASFLATGSCGRLGSDYVITIKLIHIETGETLVSVKSNFNNPASIPEELDSLTKDMADKIALLE